MSKIQYREDFTKYKSKCSNDSKTVVCDENKRKHILENISRRIVFKYKVDGDIYDKNEDILRVDYLVLADKNKGEFGDAFIIELKGSKIIHGLQQIESSVNEFSSALKGYKIHARLIHSSGVHKIFASPEANKLLKKFMRLKIDFKSSADVYREKI